MRRPPVSNFPDRRRYDIEIEPPQRTVTLTSAWSIRPPSVASTRTTYSPGSLKVAVTGHRRSSGSGGVSQPGVQGELAPSR